MSVGVSTNKHETIHQIKESMQKGTMGDPEHTPHGTCDLGHNGTCMSHIRYELKTTETKQNNGSNQSIQAFETGFNINFET